MLPYKYNLKSWCSATFFLFDLIFCTSWFLFMSLKQKLCYTITIFPVVSPCLLFEIMMSGHIFLFWPIYFIYISIIIIFSTGFFLHHCRNRECALITQTFLRFPTTCTVWNHDVWPGFPPFLLYFFINWFIYILIHLFIYLFFDCVSFHVIVEVQNT